MQVLHYLYLIAVMRASCAVVFAVDIIFLIFGLGPELVSGNS